MAIYLTVPLCAWWLLPELIKEEALFVCIALIAYITPLMAAIIKFKRIPSYHTYGAKIAAILMSTAIIVLFMTEFIEHHMYSPHFEDFLHIFESVH